MNAPDTALQGQDTTITGRLYMAFELGDKSWKLSLGDGCARQPMLGRGRGYGACADSDHQGQGTLRPGRASAGAQLLRGCHLPP